MPSFSHVLLRACLSDRRAGSIVRRRFCFINDLSPRLPPPVCPVRGSACRADRSAVAAAIRRFNGLPLKPCSVSRRPHGSDSLPERRFRISRRGAVLRSRALSARREFYPLWVWLFTRPPSCLLGKEPRFLSLADRPHYPLPGYASKRSLIGPSSCLTIGPALCSADRSNRSFRPGGNSRRCFSSLRPGVFSPPPFFFPPTLFTPRSPCFFNRALSPCFFRLSLCRSYRWFVSPRRPACPHPAASRLRPTLRIVVSPVRAPSVCLVALSPLCPDVYTPNGFVFRTTTPCDPFRPRPGFHVKQTRTSRCFMSSTASRVNSRPHPLPGCLFHLSVLNDYLARTFPPARRYPCQTNKSFSSPYVFNRATSIFSHSVRPALRRALQRIKPPLILVLHPNRRSPPMPAFMPDGRAQAAPHTLSHPARFPLVFRVCASVYCGGKRCPGLSRLVSPLPREDKSRRSVASEKNRQNQDFRPKSRKYATNLGQKHSKIGHVENIEKADVSCETMQNSPKAGQQDKTGCARLRLQKARLRVGVLRQKRALRCGLRRLNAQAKAAWREKRAKGRCSIGVCKAFFKGRRRQMAQKRRNGSKAVQAAVCHRAVRRSVFIQVGG